MNYFNKNEKPRRMFGVVFTVNLHGTPTSDKRINYNIIEYNTMSREIIKKILDK